MSEYIYHLVLNNTSICGEKSIKFRYLLIYVFNIICFNSIEDFLIYRNGKDITFIGSENVCSECKEIINKYIIIQKRL